MRNRTVLRQRVAGQKRHERIYDRMREMRQEHEHIEGLESSPRHGRTFQNRIDEPPRGPKRSGIKTLPGDLEAARRDPCIAYQRLSPLPTGS